MDGRPWREVSDSMAGEKCALHGRSGASTVRSGQARRGGSEGWHEMNERTGSLPSCDHSLASKGARSRSRILGHASPQVPWGCLPKAEIETISQAINPPPRNCFPRDCCSLSSTFVPAKALVGNEVLGDGDGIMACWHWDGEYNNCPRSHN